MQIFYFINKNISMPTASSTSSKIRSSPSKKHPQKADKFYSDDESDSQSTEGADPTNDEDENEY